MSKKKTRKKNNRYSRKIVSRKRVSKRVSRKRVSQKRHSRKRMNRNEMKGGMDRIRSILGSVGDWLETASPEDIQRYQEWVQEKTGGPDENLEPQQLIGEYEASEPLQHEATALEPEQVADFGGIAGGPFQGDDLKFVLIPGSDNDWGKNRIPYHTKVYWRQDYNPAHWQRTIEDLIGDENILKSDPDYTGTDEFHCGDMRNKPYIERHKSREATTTQKRAPLGSIRFGAPEMRSCVENIFETNRDVNKSVISTSQGSAILIDILADNPEMLDNIVSIVFVSPATIFPGQVGDSYQKLKKFLKACEDKHISILLLLTEYNWARWNGKFCAGEAKEADMASLCHVIKQSSACNSIFIPNTTHTFDICNGCPHWPPYPPAYKQPNANNTALPQEFLESIVTWCKNPDDRIVEEMVRTSGGRIV